MCSSVAHPHCMRTVQSGPSSVRSNLWNSCMVAAAKPSGLAEEGYSRMTAFNR